MTDLPAGDCRRIIVTDAIGTVVDTRPSNTDFFLSEIFLVETGQISWAGIETGLLRFDTNNVDPRIPESQIAYLKEHLARITAGSRIAAHQHNTNLPIGFDISSINIGDKFALAVSPFSYALYAKKLTENQYLSFKPQLP